MNPIEKSQCQCHHCEHAAQGQCCGQPRVERARLLIHTASAARGGPTRMSLNDWRELEHEVNEKLQQEHSQ